MVKKSVEIIYFLNNLESNKPQIIADKKRNTWKGFDLFVYCEK